MLNIYLQVRSQFHSRNSERTARVAEDPPTDAAVVSPHDDVELCPTFGALLAGTVGHPISLEILLRVLGGEKGRERGGDM